MDDFALWFETTGVWWLLALLLLVALAIGPELYRRYRRDAEARKIAHLFKEKNIIYRKAVAFPDGVEGFAFIDYLVLTPDGILVMDMQDYNGFIFGAPNIDYWTQMVRRRGYKFENPLHQNSWRLQVIKSLTQDAPVLGRVVFSSASQFPKGLPEGVLHMSTLSADMAPMFDNKTVPDSLRATWDKLVATAIDATAPHFHKPGK